MSSTAAMFWELVSSGISKPTHPQLAEASFYRGGLGEAWAQTDSPASLSVADTV